MKIKNRYRVDERNRLIIRRKGKESVCDGRFGTAKDNGLIYWLNEPSSWRRQYGLPNKIIFKGNWKLNANYDLEFYLNETEDQHRGDCLVLKGDILSPGGDRLIFELDTVDKQGLQHVRFLSLSGFWQADGLNRITFTVKRKTAPETFILEGAWEVNENQQIVYVYEKVFLKRKTKVIRNLIFKGFWETGSSNKLVYIIQNSSKSRFDFRVQVESPNLYPQEGIIKYRIGIGLRGGAGYKGKIISLYGAWKFERKAGLAFQMDYGEGRLKKIEFETQVFLTRRDDVVFSLLDKKGKPSGIRITFTHRLLKKYAAETFLRLEGSKEKSGIEAGARILF